MPRYTGMRPRIPNPSPKEITKLWKLAETEGMTTWEVSVMTKVSLRQLQWWDEQGVVVPTRLNGVRAYSQKEVAKIGKISSLRKYHIGLKKAAIIAKSGNIDEILKAITLLKRWNLFDVAGTNS